MNDDTPTTPSDYGSLSTELRAVHRELRELRDDIRGYRDDAQSLRADIAIVQRDLAVAQRDITAAHLRQDELVRAQDARMTPWRGVLPAIVVAVIVGLLSFMAGRTFDSQPRQTMEVHP